MAANSETGTLSPIKQIVQICKAVGAYVHCDATQYVGRLPFFVESLGLDLVSLSGHKMHGPKGVGALAVARGTPIAPQSLGGGHERGLRAGTLNTPAIIGFGVAANLAASRFAESMAIQSLRDELHANLSRKLEGITLNGHPTNRLPNTLNLRFEGADAEAVMASLRRVACSAGSACHAGSQAPSHVLTAMGLSPREAHESLRFSLSRDTTKQEIHDATEDIVSAVNYIRSFS
jgi:cysteine desulfurase